jgi:hypothetical protein
VRDEKKKRGWKEMYDPVTFGFWYYNEFSLRNSWEAPLVFQKTFVCTWDGYKRFGALSTSSHRCRDVFSNEMEYRGHMINAHKWYCPAMWQVKRMTGSFFFVTMWACKFRKINNHNGCLLVSIKKSILYPRSGERQSRHAWVLFA